MSVFVTFERSLSFWIRDCPKFTASVFNVAVVSWLCCCCCCCCCCFLVGFVFLFSFFRCLFVAKYTELSEIFHINLVIFYYILLNTNKKKCYNNLVIINLSLVEIPLLNTKRHQPLCTPFPHEGFQRMRSEP